MKKDGKDLKMILGMLFITLLLAGCNDVEKYQERMKLTQEQITQTKSIFEEYDKRQDAIFESMESQRPSGGPGGMDRGPGMGMPDRSEMKTMMEKKKKEMDEKFEENNSYAVRELEKYLSAEQIEEFKKIANEIREKKKKEMMSQQPGGGRGGPGGGMGGPGGGMGGSGGGMGGFGGGPGGF